MAVALRGYTQGLFDSDGHHSIAWPAGTAAGDLAVLLCATGKDKTPGTKLAAGWRMAKSKSGGESLWWKMLTATDIAGPLLVTARVALLQVLSGAAGIGAVGSGEGMTVRASGGLLLAGWKTTGDTLTVSNKIHPIDVINESYVVKGTTRVYNTWFTPSVSDGYARIDTNASYFFALVLEPQLAPYAPTIISPENGSGRDAGSIVTLTLRHNSSSGSGLPGGAHVRAREIGTSTWHYLGRSFTASPPFTLFQEWDASSPGVGVAPDDLITIQLPGATWMAATAGVEWQAATSETGAISGPTIGPWSPLFTFAVKPKPTLVPSIVTAAGDLTPIVNWTETLTTAGQTAYQVQVEVATALGSVLADFDMFATLGELDTFTLGDLDSF